MNYYHYTVWEHAKSIIRDGLIKKEKSRGELLDQFTKEGDIFWLKVYQNVPDFIPVLWLSSNEWWEETVIKKMGISGIKEHAYLKPVRFMINPNAVKIKRWTEYKRIDPEHARGLARLKGKADCYQWFWTEEPIAISEQTIMAFDLYDDNDGAWKRVSEHFAFFKTYQ